MSSHDKKKNLNTQGFIASALKDAAMVSIVLIAFGGISVGYTILTKEY